ncbi:hypothetical protein [Labrys miyagiensis]
MTNWKAARRCVPGSGALFEFREAAILFTLSFEADGDGITLNIDSSYGVLGRIKAKHVAVSFEPASPRYCAGFPFPCVCVT